MTYVERKTLLAKAYWKGESPTWDNPYADGCSVVNASDIEDAPAADVVKVTKCEDCKLYIPSTTGISWQGWCKRFRNHMDTNDYCSRGKEEG